MTLCGTLQVFSFSLHTGIMQFDTDDIIKHFTECTIRLCDRRDVQVSDSTVVEVSVVMYPQYPS